MGVVQVGGSVAGVLGVSLVVRRWLLGRLARMARENPKSFAARLREDLSTPTLLWCLAISIDVLMTALSLSPRLENIGHTLVVSFLILSLTMVASAVVTRSLQRYGEGHNLPFAVAGLTKTLTRTFVYSLGLLILLGYLGIAIAPVLTALGVGGLAIALALQDTLANLFAGVHILVERPIAVGDMVRLSADEEGIVSDIGWRTTRLVTGANNTVVIPNKTITSVNLINYSLPLNEAGVFVPVMLGLEADVAKAEQVALAAAKATEGVMAEPPPMFLADPGMQPTHLQYRLSFRVAAQQQAGPIRTRLIQKMLEGFRNEGIPLPDPKRY